MKKLTAILLITLFALASQALAVSTSQTNLDVLDNTKSLYGEKTNGQGAQLIGINSSDKVVIDSSGLGVDMSGDFQVSLFGEYEKASSGARASTVNNGTVTPVQTFQLVDTALDTETTATVNTIATANVTIGSVLILETVIASRDIVFVETGNLDLGGTSRTLSDPRDKLILIKSADNQWDELSFVDNN